MKRIKKNDMVIVLAGKDKGTVGTVIAVLPKEDKVLVEGVNRVRKCVRANPQANEAGGIKEINKPIHISNVALYNPETKKADRVSFKVIEDASGSKRKVRVFRSNNEVLKQDA